MSGWIPLDQCKPRRLYRIASRNLSVGVFDGEHGFLGIREKMGRLFVFTEYHWDQDYFPTAKPIEDMGEDLPADIKLTERLGIHDTATKRPVAFDDTPALPEEGGNSAGFKGWYFTDSREHSPYIHPMSEPNTPLFNWLEERDDGRSPQPEEIR